MSLECGSKIILVGNLYDTARQRKNTHTEGTWDSNAHQHQDAHNNNKLGLAQKQLLYCRVGIGYHLQILPNGNIGGVHEPTEYCWLKVFSMQWGVVGIKGLKSNLYLCMSSAGIAWGSHFMAECLFREDMEEDHYTTYASASHPGLYLALSHNGQAKRGNTVQKENPCAHFLPRLQT
uniref:Fibroblast growth factor n=1 Tax=Paramormyrops kingsleyae TaxID=1676925 RepID=A0A3B3RGB6_9TELE